MKFKLLSSLLAIFYAAEIFQVFRFWNCDYDTYIKKVTKNIPKGSTVLASSNYWIGLHKDYKLVPSEYLFYKSILDARGIKTEYFKWTDQEWLERQGIQYVVMDEEAKNGTLSNSMKAFVPSVGKWDVISDFFYSDSRFMNRKNSHPMFTDIYKVQ